MEEGYRGEKRKAVPLLARGFHQGAGGGRWAGEGVLARLECTPRVEAMILPINVSEGSSAEIPGSVPAEKTSDGEKPELHNQEKARAQSLFPGLWGSPVV